MVQKSPVMPGLAWLRARKGRVGGAAVVGGIPSDEAFDELDTGRFLYCAGLCHAALSSQQKQSRGDLFESRLRGIGSSHLFRCPTIEVWFMVLSSSIARRETDSKDECENGDPSEEIILDRLQLVAAHRH